MTSPTRSQPAQLPATLRSFLTAHTARDATAALRTFTPTAVVVDEGQTFRGTDEVARFLAESGTAWTYTTELVAVDRVDDTHWVVTNHLEGDFPGGTADLRYRFVLDGDLIAELVIAP